MNKKITAIVLMTVIALTSVGCKKIDSPTITIVPSIVETINVETPTIEDNSISEDIYKDIDENVIRPYRLTCSEYFGDGKQPRNEGNHQANLTYINDKEIRIDIYEMEPYHRADIESLKNGDRIIIQGEIVEVDRVEVGENNAKVYPVKTEDSNPSDEQPIPDENGFIQGNHIGEAIVMPFSFDILGDGIDDYVLRDATSLAYRKVKTINASIASDFIYLVAGQKREKAEFLTTLESEPKAFVYTTVVVEIYNDELASVVLNTDTTSNDTNSAYEIPIVENAVNPVYLTDDNLNGIPTNGLNGNMVASLHYVDDKTISADLYAYELYETETLETIQKGDKIVIRGNTIEVVDFGKVDYGHFKSITINSLEEFGKEYVFDTWLDGTYYREVSSDAEDIVMRKIATKEFAITDSVIIECLLDNNPDNTKRLSIDEFMQGLKADESKYDYCHTNLNLSSGKIYHILNW